jgi:hypothetical protein
MDEGDKQMLLTKSWLMTLGLKKEAREANFGADRCEGLASG